MSLDYRAKLEHEISYYRDGRINKVFLNLNISIDDVVVYSHDISEIKNEISKYNKAISEIEKESRTRNWEKLVECIMGEKLNHFSGINLYNYKIESELIQINSDIDYNTSSETIDFVTGYFNNKTFSRGESRFTIYLDKSNREALADDFLII